MPPAGFLPRARVLFSQLGSSKPLSRPTFRRWAPRGAQVSGAPSSAREPALPPQGRSRLHPPGTADRPPSGGCERAAALGPQTPGKNFYFGEERAEVGQESGIRVESSGALGRGAGGPAPPPRRPPHRGLQKKQMAVRPPPRPPAEAAPRRHSAPEGAGPIARGRGARSRLNRGPGLARPANPQGFSAAGARPAPPSAAGPAPQTWRA